MGEALVACGLLSNESEILCHRGGFADDDRDYAAALADASKRHAYITGGF